jgi:hypothetical protein
MWVDTVLLEQSLGVASFILLQTRVQGHTTVTGAQNHNVIRLFRFVNVVQDGQRGERTTEVAQAVTETYIHYTGIHNSRIGALCFKRLFAKYN